MACIVLRFIRGKELQTRFIKVGQECEELPAVADGGDLGPPGPPPTPESSRLPPLRRRENHAGDSVLLLQQAKGQGVSAEGSY